ncbi:hypothetical protein [Sorangium sp. So ce341]|uniref:hypothetical protein n=1 Tax=Sorangium sp. So ce341 TaxID=3133302 RepID=UPI003F5DD826
MVRDLRPRRALRELDLTPAVPALATGLLAGTVLGFECLREPGAAGVAGFAALVAAAAALAISARPVAVPAEEPAGSGAHPPLRRRLKAALDSWATVAVIFLAWVLAVRIAIEPDEHPPPDNSTSETP